MPPVAKWREGDTRKCKEGHSYVVTAVMARDKHYVCPTCRKAFIERLKVRRKENGFWRTDVSRQRGIDWRNNNRELARAKHREAYARRKAEGRAKKPDRVKMRARWRAWDAVRRGVLTRQPCRCGNPKSEAHHEDYSKPLDVQWLCKSCHEELHMVQERERTA